MICNHCGKEVESLSSQIAGLHDQGLTVVQIREKLSERMSGNDHARYVLIYSLLRGMDLKPHRTHRAK